MTQNPGPRHTPPVSSSAVNTTAVLPFDVPLLGDERRKNWAKVVDNVDVEKTGGWAYGGDFVPCGGVVDLPAPCVLLVYGERGSRANPQVEARIYAANTDGTLSLRDTAAGRAWARTLRDTVAELLDTGTPPALRPWEPALMGYRAEELARRRA